MRYETTIEEKEKELNKVYLEEDDMEIQINFIDKLEDIYLLNTRAIIEGEAYNNFEVEVQLACNEEITCVSDILNFEWEWYDLRF